MKAILAAINLEALPPTPSEGRNRKYNELEEERLLKAVQRLGTDALVSPVSNFVIFICSFGNYTVFLL